MKQFTFSLDISFLQFQQHYSGVAANVVVTSDTGLRLQIPAVRFRSFLGYDGIHGHFRLMVDDQNKFLRLEKMVF